MILILLAFLIHPSPRQQYHFFFWEILLADDLALTLG